MSLVDKLIGTIVPHECLSCDREGAVLCAACTGLFETIPERCYRCAKLSPRARTCPKCRRASRLKRVRVAVAYDALAKDLIWQLKFHGAQAAVRIMADRMTNMLSDEAAVFVPVPTATSRARGRGYDQAKLLARELSRRTGLPYRDCLSRTGQTHQVGASRQERLRQLQDAFWLKERKSISNQRIILVDDVLTTGATLEAAAKVFHAVGYKEVDAIVFAQA